MLNKSNKQFRELRFGLGALRKITQNGRTGPSSLKRSFARLSESNDESLGFARLQLAYGSLKRTANFQNSGQKFAWLA